MAVTKLRAMPDITVDHENSAVMFRFESEDGTPFDFACHVSALPEIVAKFVAAGEQAGQKVDPDAPVGSMRNTPAMEIREYQIALAEPEPIVLLTLQPMQLLPLSVALSVPQTRTLSANLQKAAAAMEKRTKSRKAT